jgi:hypothetical protein
MTAAFVNELRTVDDDVIRVGGGNGSVLHIRVQAAELWDTLRVDAPASGSVESVKTAALDRFFPLGCDTNEFVVKLRGFEILDEMRSLEDAGVKDGSTLLVSRRRRRPVKS